MTDKLKESKYPYNGAGPAASGDPRMKQRTAKSGKYPVGGPGPQKNVAMSEETRNVYSKDAPGPEKSGDKKMRDYKKQQKGAYPASYYNFDPLKSSGDEDVYEGVYPYNGGGPKPGRGAMEKNSVKNPAGGGAYPYGSGSASGEGKSDRDMARLSNDGTGYANKGGGFKKMNPAMTDRTKGENKGAYPFSKDGSKKMNKAMTAEARLARLTQMKEQFEAKIRMVREQREAAYKNSLAYLLEFASSDVMQKAELVTAAKAVSDTLQKMAVELVKIIPDDLMPLEGNMKTAFGPEVADRFIKSATEKLNALSAAISDAKSTIDTQIAQLEGSVDGSMPNDMSMPGDPMAGGGDMMSGPNDAADLEAGGDMAMGGDELPPTDDAALDSAAADAGLDAGTLGGDDMSAAGRARKESFHRNAAALREARNPDFVIFNAFRHALRESNGHAVIAATRVSERFGVDFDDVVAIVKEGKTYKDEKKSGADKKNKWKDRNEKRNAKKSDEDLDEGKSWRGEDNKNKKSKDEDRTASRKRKSEKDADLEEGKSWRGEDNKSKQAKDKERDENRNSKKKDEDLDEGKSWRGEDNKNKKSTDQERSSARSRKRGSEKEQVEEESAFSMKKKADKKAADDCESGIAKNRKKAADAETTSPFLSKKK